MTRRMSASEAIENYVWAHSREGAIAARLREETAKLPQAGMQIGPDQAAFLALLVRAIGARCCIEIGTFTGMSALAVASALPDDGRLICCDISAEWTSIARRYWAQAGVAARIDLRLAPALDTLRDLAMTERGRFDFAFIDADKARYDAYYEACLELLRTGGVIALDNMLWSGKVADANVHDADTDAIRALNAKIHADARVDATLLTIGDGVMLARKR
ncbi:MAG: class I SAM-dependent methyltransferase [Xanthomonadaceae bacterium]|nr:class I SAM-dependent methyltransferase [Xanthomonadaceae bacterium]MDE1960062.1 class I SAM-dependent methyltransferase [Xanthomonadaceae bacterium]MDE2257420.1 class I SAM-dependent methyltransferase [Xanthomonadaceae bacterium]